MNRISVIVSTYEHGKTIERTLKALLAQTRPPDEILVIDDGSTDETKEVLCPFLDRVRYFYQSHQGAPAARNYGYRESVGEIVLFCDADVIMRQDMLSHLEQALVAHPNASYAYCGFRWGWKQFRCRSFDPHVLRERNFIHTSAALIRREHFPGFDETLKKFQDWDLWLTMLERGHTGIFVDEDLYTVMQDHGRNNMSSWLPKVAYVIPWQRLGWKPKRIVQYEHARDIIKHKHGF